MESTATGLTGLSPVTWGVLIFLSFYLIATFWIFISRFLVLSSWLARERDAAESLAMGGTSLSPLSVLQGCARRAARLTRPALEVCLNAATREATTGLTSLSVIASTSPFVGLFGTVVSILQTFSAMGSAGNASMNILAPQISEALVATASGIFVAIFAYAFHLLLKRRAYEVTGYVRMQIDMVTAES